MDQNLKRDASVVSGQIGLASPWKSDQQVRVDPGRGFSRLSGHIALVTGGGTGIGRAIATHMVSAGAKVIILGRTLEPLEETAEQLGEQCTYVVHDLCELHAADGFVQSLVESLGAPSILVNNAGEHLKLPATETPPEEFSRIMRTHVDGAFSLSRAVAKSMIDSGRKDCSILFISSMASLFGIPGVAAYSAAKTAQLGLVRTLATEWSPQGIRVNCIAPGWIDTSMSQAAFAKDHSRLERVVSRTPMGRLGTTEEVARAATFLVSSEASFISGAVLPVDGGASIGF